MMRNAAGHLMAWTICIALALLIGEVAGAIIFYRQQGQFVYANRRAIEAVKQEAQEQPVGQRLHPYLGFGGYYSLASATQTNNNLGFGQNTPYKVPFATKADDLAVFVFGGSVAGNIVAPPQAGTSLEQALKKKMPDRNIIVYSMAQGSSKQPQQLMALSMLLAMGQHVDVVVNLDGFNDVAIGYSNHFYGVHPIFPSIAILWGIANTLASDGDRRTVDFYRTAADILEAKLAIGLHANRANLSRSGVIYLYHKTMISFFARQRAAAEAKYVTAMRGTSEGLERAKRLLGLDLPVDAKADAAGMAFDLWLRSSEAMAVLTRSTGATYVHIIQPNQYFTRKKFSPEEAKIALSLPPTETMRVGAERGYPLFEKNAGELAKRGIVSGIAMFDDQPGAMYVDNCCHYTRAGEDILANFVADQIVAGVSKTRNQ